MDLRPSGPTGVPAVPQEFLAGYEVKVTASRILLACRCVDYKDAVPHRQVLIRHATDWSLPKAYVTTCLECGMETEAPAPS